MKGWRRGAATLAACLLLAELLLPTIWGHLILAKVPGASDDSEVVLSGRPALAWLGGTIPRIEMNIPQLQGEKLALRQVHGVFSDVHLSLKQLVSGRLENLTAQAVDVTATIGEEELVRLLSRPEKGIKEVSVTITPELVLVQGTFSPGGLLSLRLSLEGQLILQDQVIVLQTKKLRINNSDASGLIWSALGKIPVMDGRQLPFALRPTSVVQEDGQARVLLHAGR